MLCGGLLAAMKKVKRRKEEGECAGERPDPYRLTGGRAAAAGPSLGCQRVGGREKQQERRILCSDDVFYPFRHPAESLHALHSAASCLFVYKCHRKLSKIKKNPLRLSVLKFLNMLLLSE